MNKRQWKDTLRPFVDQFAMLAVTTDTKIIVRPHNKRVLGTRIDSSHEEVLLPFVLDGACLKKSDDTILLANQHAKVYRAPSDLSEDANQTVFGVILQLHKEDVAAGRPSHPVLANSGPIRLPACLLMQFGFPMSVSGATIRTSLEEVETRNKSTRTETKFLFGNEAVRSEIVYAKPDLKQVTLMYALAELSQQHPGPRVGHDLTMDPQARLQELHGLLSAVSMRNPQKEQRKLIEAYQDLLILLGQGDHALVATSRKILHPAKPDLPSPTISR